MNRILENPKFQAILENIESRNGNDSDDVRDQVESYLKELYTEHHDLTEAIVIQCIEYILARGYNKTIDVDHGEIRDLAKVMRNHPVAFVMTHKTYIDMFVLTLVLARHGLPLPYTFAGINMAFPGLAELGRKSGAIFIRRSFKDDRVY